MKKWKIQQTQALEDMAVAVFSERFITTLKRNQGHYYPHMCSLQEGLTVSVCFHAHCDAAERFMVSWVWVEA